MGLSILPHLLPSWLLGHFDIIEFKEFGDVSIRKDCFFIYLDEKNQLPEQYDSGQYEPKGFYERTLIQDFPIRGKAVYLHMRR